ncbi:hypothetical protein MALU111345_13180 [Marinicrinis lubricantis]
MELTQPFMQLLTLETPKMDCEETFGLTQYDISLYYIRYIVLRGEV